MLNIRSRNDKINKVIKILQVKDLEVGYSENKDFTAVEEGQTLEEYVKDREFLEAKNVYNITLSICETLSNLNSLNYSIMHSQLVPSNIIINSNMRIYIKDLGVSKNPQFYNSNFACISSIKSTYDNKLEFFKASSKKNINSIGILMYFMATGKEPVTMLQPLLEDSYGSNVESSLKRIIKKCFYANSKKRYVSIEELNKEIVIELLLKNKYEKIERLCSSYRESDKPLNNRVTRSQKRKSKLTSRALRFIFNN